MKISSLSYIGLSLLLCASSAVASQQSIVLAPRSAERLKERLSIIVALHYCRSRLNGFADSVASMNWAKAQARTRYPLLVRQAGSLADQAVIKMARNSCPYVFNQAIKLPDAKPPKPPRPVTISVHRPASECSLDAYWVDRLRRNRNLYLDGKKQRTSVASDARCLVEFANVYLP